MREGGASSFSSFQFRFFELVDVHCSFSLRLSIDRLSSSLCCNFVFCLLSITL